MTTAATREDQRLVPSFTIQDRLRKAREVAGLEQDDLGDLLGGLNRRTVGNYEQGITPPKKPMIIAWAMACDVDYDWLLGDYEAPPRKPRGRRNNPCYSGHVIFGPWGDVSDTPSASA